MIYHFFLEYNDIIKYITFRAVLAAAMAFCFCAVFGPLLISWLKKKQFYEKVEKKDSELLARMSMSKKNIPTMGGLLIAGAVIFATLLWTRLDNILVLLGLFTLVEFTLLGYIDDYIKFASPNRKGITKRFKLFCQVAIGLIIGYTLYYYFLNNVPDATVIYIPGVKYKLDLGPAYPFFVMLVITASSNAVNLTDGLDGLAGGCVAMALLAFAIIAYAVGRTDFSKYLNVTFVNMAGELTILCAATIGAVMGFLWFNCFPATIFMGNTGALPLGGLLGVIAASCKQEFLLFVVGFIFVLETVSVIIQIISFRVWGKRVFRIAPIHHHYQAEFPDQPWYEAKVTVRFWIISAIVALIAIATLKL